MKDYHLSRTLFTTADLEVRSYIVLPRLINTSNPEKMDVINLSVVANPCLIIKNTKNSFNNKGASTEKGYRNFYTMNIRNHHMTRRFFARVLNWFENPNMQDLFYVTDIGELEFNYDYKDLKASVPLTKYTESALEARPTILTKYGNREEGVAFCINSTENECILSWREFEAFADIVMSFDFISEALLLMNSFKLSCELQRVSTPEQERIERRLSAKNPFAR